MPPFGWRSLPALRHALALATGIAFSELFSVPAAWALLAVAFAWLLLATGLRYRAVPALAILCVAFTSGVLLDATDRFANAAPRGLRIEAIEIVGTVDESSSNGSFVIRCDSLIHRRTVTRLRDRVLVRLREPRATAPALGWRVSAVGTLESPGGPAFPGGFEVETWLRRRNIRLTASTRTDQLHVIERRTPPPASLLLEWIREHARGFAREHVGGPEGAIVRALLLGERDEIEADTRDAFSRTGTVHVLAVSGLHVSVIALGLFVLVSWIPNRKAQSLVFIAALGLYALVAGASPSIVRAWCMAGCVMLARVAGRQTNSLNVLGFSALIILLLDPSAMLDLGFQLSFASVGGILLLYGRIVRAGRDVAARVRGPAPAARGARLALRWLVPPVAVTLSAQLFTIPLLLYHFGYVPLLGLALNLVVVPLTSLALGVSLIGTLVGAFSAVAACYGATAWCAVHAALWLVRAGSSVPGVGVGVGYVPAIAAAVLGLLCILAAVSSSFTRFVVRCGAALVASVLLTISLRRGDPLLPNGTDGAYILGTPAGRAVVASRADTLVAYVRERDEARAVERALARLAARLAASQWRVVVLPMNRRTADNGFVASIGGRQWCVRRPPMLLVASRLRDFSMVRFGGRRALQIPLATPTRRAYVLHYDGSWHYIAWR